MTKRQAIHAFFSRFGKFYEVSAAPTGENAPAFPYGTYEGVSDSFNSVVPMAVQWWDRSPSWEAADAKAEEIAEAVSRGGVLVHCDRGAIWIMPASPFVRDMGDDSDAMLKVKQFNFQVEFITNV